MTGKRFFAGILIVFLIAVMNLSPRSREWVRLGVRKNLAPIQNLLAGGRSVGETAGAILRPGALLDKNRLLQEQVENLRFELSQVDALKSENDSLRRSLGLKSRISRKLLLCNVTTRGDASGWWQTLTLDRGSAHGIRADMPVLVAEGIVGRTQHVTAYNSEVLLLTDPTFKISCRTGRSGILGIVQGQGTGVGGDGQVGADFALNPCRLDMASRASPLQENEPVLTSGLGGIFPPDLTVGYLTEPALDESKLFQTATVTPAVPVDRLDRVFVMLDGGKSSGTNIRRPDAETDEDNP